ncbi:MAG: hypothetical protein HKP24_01400 [Croceitalea sp.]|nr:hypothetical protein [Croceitalea sp.]NNM17201.1 hypothetical protein [Croceitalea sp.]
MKQIIILVFALGMIACQNQSGTITNVEDYNAYLVNGPLKTTSKYFELWNSKIKSDSIQTLSFGNVANEYNRYFQETGDIAFLIKAEKSLQKAVEFSQSNKEGYRRALARNYISQHRFKEALVLAQEARELKGGLPETLSLLFDVHMELGNYDKAEKYLDSINNMSDFGYLIRLAKWNDYKGDLNTTLTFMEKAMKKAESSKNKDLKIWAYSNIADYYGHAGKIQDSYNYYLKTLELDNNNAYAKKGIAWIVYSHEKNGKEAMRILNSVTENHKSPDYYLLKAEIAEYLNDTAVMNNNLDQYYKLAQNPLYGDMYNGYTISFLLDHAKEYQRALRLAQKEVDNRPTPESYDYLAQAYVQMGEHGKALDIVDKHIIGETFEPAILLNAAKILKLNNDQERVVELKKELAGAEYELGPMYINQLQSL